MISVPVFCVLEQKHVEAYKTNGKEIYPHRPDLYSKVFWKCPNCGGYVGVHNDGTERPLGCIPTPELRKARMKIHAVIDPLWKEKKIKRKHVYARLTKAIGYQYHSAEIKSVEEADKIYQIALGIKENVLCHNAK